MTFRSEERPSHQLARVLAGDLALNDAPKAVQSWARLYVYRQALQVMRQPTRDQRRAALAAVPDTIRSAVKAEVERLWRRC